MTEEKPHVIVSDSGGVQVVEFADRKILEEFTISQIGDHLGDLVDKAADVKLLLSFVQVEHLSSAALGMLIKLHHQIQKKKGKLALSDINSQIYEVFKITRLNKLFDIHDTKEAALRSF